MKKYVYSVILFLGIIFCACNEHSKINFYGNTAEEIITKVENHKDSLETINELYERKNISTVYENITYLLLVKWASSQIMNRWYKIWIVSAKKSKKFGNNKKYLNEISCQALIWYIRVDDKKAIKALPQLTSLPLFEKAKNLYLHEPPNKFVNWAREKINETTIPHKWYYLNMYCKLLESAAIATGDFDLARKANEILYINGNDLFMIEAASNLAFYVNKLNKITNKDKSILIDCYNKILKDKQAYKILKKRREYILSVLRKYNILPVEDEGDD